MRPILMIKGDDVSLSYTITMCGPFFAFVFWVHYLVPYFCDHSNLVIQDGQRPQCMNL